MIGWRPNSLITICRFEYLYFENQRIYYLIISNSTAAVLLHHRRYSSGSRIVQRFA